MYLFIYKYLFKLTSPPTLDASYISLNYLYWQHILCHISSLWVIYTAHLMYLLQHLLFRNV
jgi:hypothetical protein